MAAAWGIGPPTTSLEAARPTGASQAQSPSEDDSGDGKSNRLLASCPAFRYVYNKKYFNSNIQIFRNELGCEQIRRLALCRQNMALRITTASNKVFSLDDDTETWQRGIFSL